MAKNKLLKNPQKQTNDFDLSDMMSGPAQGEEAMVGMMTGMVEASRHQVQMAIELTKMILDKNANSSLEVDEVLSIFRQASKTITLNSPIRELWEKMSA